MKKILKLILLTSFTCSSLSNAIANEQMKSSSESVISDLKVKLTGYAHFQAAYRNQANLSGDEKNLSNHNRDFAFYNDAAFVVNASNQLDDFTYGAKIIIVPTAKKKGGASYNGTHIYFETDYGRFEAGSPVGVATTMSETAGSVTSATGGDWDRYATFKTQYLKGNRTLAPAYATFVEFFLDSKLVTDLSSRKYSSEPSRRINYYTPKFEITNSSKMQLGFSYTPDSSNTGADNPGTNSSGTTTETISNTQNFKLDQTVKNAFAVGVVLEQNISDGIDLKLALTGEIGKSAGKGELIDIDPNTKAETVVSEHKLADLRTYNIGSVLNVGNFSYAASFGSLDKSLTTDAYHKTGRNVNYYTGGIGYKQGPFSASVSYFRSGAYKNMLDCVTVGTDYKLAPGFKPYAEISQFSFKGKPEYYPEDSRKSTRGTVALIGAKLSL